MEKRSPRKRNTRNLGKTFLGLLKAAGKENVRWDEPMEQPLVGGG